MTEYFQIMGHKLVSDQAGHRLVSDHIGHQLVSDQLGHRLVNDQVLQRPVRRSFVVDMREVFACENVSNFTSVFAYNQHQVRYFCPRVLQLECPKLPVKNRDSISPISTTVDEKKLLRARP